MVLAGVLTMHQAESAISISTLALLFGMMVVIHYATISGLLEMAAETLLTRCHTPRRLLFAVCITAGVLSALFVNDTICLLLTPLLLVMCKRASLNPRPFLIALATSSNAGSVMTLTGNPQNMLIGQSSHWAWGAFAVRMIPVGIFCLLINWLLVFAFYHADLPGVPLNWQQPRKERLNKKLAVRTLFTLAGLLILLLMGVEMSLAALCAAVAILVLANRPPEEAFAQVDWALLLFFAGLFVVVAGVTASWGEALARIVPLLTKQPGTPAQMLRFSAAAVIGGNLFSNVPYVMLLRQWIVHQQGAPLLWLTLAASSTLAGNLTLTGSVANLIVAEKARETTNLTFFDFLRVGLASTLLTVLAALCILWGYARFGFV